MTEIVVPGTLHLPSYVDALKRGWSADNVRGAVAAREELEAMERDVEAFLASQIDVEARGAPIQLPDGRRVPRLPGMRLWICDGEEVCGSINLRWQAGTADLPPHVLGHIGYAVVPWKRNQGHATRALALMLEKARDRGLPHVDLTTDLGNLASQKVLKANGAVLVETFRKDAAYGGAESLLWRIALGPR